MTRRRFLLRMAGFAAAAAAASLWPWNVAFADHKWVGDAKKIREWIQERQALEVMLAWDLLETFNKDKELIGGLHAMATKALEEIVGLSTLGKKAVAAVEKAIAAEAKNMTLLKKRQIVPAKGSTHRMKGVKKFKDLKQIVEAVPHLDAQDCSDLIRLYGTVVEEVARADKKGFKKYADLEKKKDSYRKGVDGASDEIWNKDPKRKFGRHRFFKPKQYAEYEEALEKTGVGAVREFLQSQGGGQSLFALADSSTLGRIDRAFGFVEAADISGTTADTLFFMNRFMSESFDPLFQLLPLATIVAGAHHSLLEVALVLTLNGVCNYHLGYYTTLRPKRAGKYFSKGWKEIKAALAAAEKHKNNHHMLVAYKGKSKKKKHRSIDGAYEFSKKDKKFRRFCHGKTVLKAFKKIGAFPSKKDIKDIIGKHKIF